MPLEIRHRRRIRVRGLVQGVGFRPHVFLLARDCGVTGWVRNDAAGVLIEVESTETRVLDGFARDLAGKAPPLSRIDRVEVESIPVVGDREFRITESDHQGAGKVSTSIIPDAAVCRDCLRELFDPNDRHYRYPFLNCTHCGPRYTITRRLPYDRPQTAMAAFSMCADCAREYHDPLDRRFHAQPVACPKCGPKLSVETGDIVQRLKAGEILAIKGIGGFHLACDATRDDVVRRLRERKDRESKPFAVMALNRPSMKALADVSDDAWNLLSSPAAPIVLCPKTASCVAAAGVAPGLSSLGVMLPYAPLHYLLFWEAAGRPAGTDWLQQPCDFVLVMTSANPGGEPLVTGNDEAKSRLKGIADLIVTHDRDIVIRADDGVVTFASGRPVVIRRARGMVPRAIKLSKAIPSVLSVGAEWKNTVCVTRGDEAFVSQHIGDMDNVATVGFFEETIDHLLSILEVKPQRVAHDLHPDFLATRWAQQFGDQLGIPAIAVQHHHAHVAAVCAEHQVDGPVLGLAIDGFGLGPSAALWGGELLLVDGARYERLGHLRNVSQPGGDKAAVEPWRMGMSLLHSAGMADQAMERFGRMPSAKLVDLMLTQGAGVPVTSSLGRLFDGVAAILGVQVGFQYEGQAAMMLESLVKTPRVAADGYALGGDLVLDFLPLMRELVGTDAVRGAELFHGTLVAGLLSWMQRAAKKTGIHRVAVCGGCALNGMVLRGLVDGAAACELELLVPREMPPGDGSVSLGQAWIAGLSGC